MTDFESEAGEDSLDRELVRQILDGTWRILRWPLALLGLILGWILFLAVSMVIVGAQHSSRNADVAIVLGGGVTDGRPSPPFEVRIAHGVALYKAGRVKALLMTGGSIMGQREESLVARDRAIAMGVPASAILVDTRSVTTWLNFVEARQVMAAHGAHTALIVTEPLHMMRSLKMAHDLGIDAAGDPTPHSFYRNWSDWFAFMRSELILYHYYLRYGR